MSEVPQYRPVEDGSNPNVVSDVLVKSESNTLKTELLECSCHSKDGRTAVDPNFLCAGCGVVVKSEVDSYHPAENKELKLEIKKEEGGSDFAEYIPPSLREEEESDQDTVSSELSADLQNHLQLLLATQKRISGMPSDTPSPSLKRLPASSGFESLCESKCKKTGKYIFNCNINLCSYKTYLKLQLRYHVNTKHAEEKPWKCSKCHFATAKGNSIEMHKKCHDSAHPYVCKFCDYSSPSLLQLDAHIKGHPDGHLFYKCPECDFNSCIADNLYHHLGVAHSHSISADKQWKCDKCSLAFAYRTTLNAHRKSHSDVVEVCETESKKESEKDVGKFVEQEVEKEVGKELKKAEVSFRQHKMNFYDCELCNYTTRNKLNLRLHINVKHAREKPWKCTKCHFASGSLNNLIFHEQCHGSNNQHTCHFCDYSTHSFVQLDVHINGHPDARALKCPHCDYTTFVAYKFNEHYNKSHPMDSQNNRAPVQNNRAHVRNNRVPVQSNRAPAQNNFAPAQKWKCCKCDLTFLSRKSLNTHVKCHDQEEALFHCKICQFSASTTKLFDHHMRQHNDQINECPKCDFKSYFLDLFNGHLQSHMQTQLSKNTPARKPGEKIWQCEKCEYSSDFESLLKGHLQIHVTEQLCSEFR